MKNLELKNLGVQEMNVAEMTKVEGGGLLNDILTGVVGSVVGTVNAVAADASVFLNKTLTNVLKFVWSL
ncbi:hypothetical protein SAMN05421820_105308 [Pedobacter steynii]|jgi:uncharacterized membrane protein YeaQ/YmgE (transglycosylase-associated protein family)|uniref:Bacteriocin-type signal sequence-containing protein n=1 Tax=Pedobacter steynii TaxID=430522 RepID=A0A1G9WY16_9SPHI|nr:hypothetical protein [Pedobacter steynii]NQX40421.1 hypothetical protein [Pedobacter steynii]SDM89066.1 hypothetical protein SAMN05421820_105308 [Pedobacter steynii]